MPEFGRMRVMKKVLLTLGVLGVGVASYFGYIFWSKKINPLSIIKKNAQEKVSDYFKKENKDKGEPVLEFALVGDVHQNFKVFDKIKAEIEADKNISFIGILGDFTKVGGEKEFVEWQAHKPTIPTYFVKGPHDAAWDKSGENFKKYFGVSYYSFEKENVKVIVVDESDLKNGFSNEQLAWLEDEFKKSSQNSELKAQILLTHIPPNFPFATPEDAGQKNEVAKAQNEKFIELIKKYNPARVYSGHLHNYFTYPISETKVVVTGGGGGESHNIPFYKDAGFHWTLVKVYKDGTIEEEIHKVE